MHAEAWICSNLVCNPLKDTETPGSTNIQGPCIWDSQNPPEKKKLPSSRCLVEDEKAETSETPLFHQNNTNLVQRGS